MPLSPLSFLREVVVGVGRIPSTNSEEGIQMCEEYIQISVPFTHKVLVVSREIAKMDTEQEVQELCNIGE